MPIWRLKTVKVEICTKFPVENYVDFGEKCFLGFGRSPDGRAEASGDASLRRGGGLGSGRPTEGPPCGEGGGYRKILWKWGKRHL